MSKSNKIADLPGDHVAQARTALVALGSDDEFPVWENSTGKQVKITGVVFIPETAVTGDDTNNFLLKIVNRGLLGVGSTAVTVVKEYDTGTDLVALKPDTIALSATAASLLVEPGEVLTFEKTETATGLALPAGLVHITYEHLALA